MKKLSLREIQLSSLEILNRIVAICEALNLKYVLAYGTLLGAVRHKGFIPWDDDLDIMMSRPDYESLLSYLDSHSLDILPLKVLNMKTEKKCPHFITRITDTRYKLDVVNEHDYNLGTFIDIYVLDGLGSTQEEAERIVRATMNYPSLIFQSTRIYYHFGNTKGWIRKLAKFPVFLYSHLMGKNYFVKKLNKILNRLNYDESIFVGCVAWGERPSSPLKKILQKEWIEDTIFADFEDSQFRIPRNFDAVLKLNYGDYMQLPPVKERLQHHLYTAYKK